MKAKVGLWIDHRKAVIVTVTDKGEETKVVESNVEKQSQRSGDSPMEGHFESQKVRADDSRQRAFTRELDVYYDAVIACLRDAESILILGPGEAKNELKKRLDKKRLGRRIEGVGTADKMTDRQIELKIREYFAE